MNELHQTNPYAPTKSASRPLPVEGARLSQVPTLHMMLATQGGIVLSGAAFGMILGGIVAVANASQVAEVVILLPIGLVTGAIMAAISGVPTLIVVTCLSSPLVHLSRGWYRYQAFRFAPICGFVSGILPVILIDARDPYSWLACLVPGVFGAVGTSLFVRWILGPSRADDAISPNRTLVEASGENVP
jgi:hypothetical protein